MADRSSRSSAPNQTGRQWRARLKLGFSWRDGRRSVLSWREHEGPILVQRALYPEGPGVCHLAILHPPSGIAGGDVIDIDIGVGAGAHAVLTTPGATRWYKANGRQSLQTARLSVAAGGRLDWLPLENIFFEHADAVSRCHVHLASGARAIGWDISQLGSIGKATHWDAGQARFEMSLKVEDKLLWVDQGTIGASDAIRHGVTGLAGLPVHATLWCFGTRLPSAEKEVLADMMPWSDTLRGGITEIPYDDRQSLTLVRSIGLHAEEVRNLLITAWVLLRESALGVPGIPLRLWST